MSRRVVMTSRNAEVNGNTAASFCSKSGLSIVINPLMGRPRFDDDGDSLDVIDGSVSIGILSIELQRT